METTSLPATGSGALIAARNGVPMLEPIPEMVDNDERTGRIRVADHIRSESDFDSDDGVPVVRPKKSKHRDRQRPEREDSGAVASDIFDVANDFARKQFGAGLSDEAKALVIGVAQRRMDAWLQRREESDATQPSGPSYPAPVGKAESRTGVVAALVTAVGLLVAIVIGAVLFFRIADRLEALDESQRTYASAQEAKLREIEQAQQVTQQTHEARLRQLESRQTALIVYLIMSVDVLLEHEGLTKPPVPTPLLIAKSEAEDLLRSRAP